MEPWLGASLGRIRVPVWVVQIQVVVKSDLVTGLIVLSLASQAPLSAKITVSRLIECDVANNWIM